MSINIYTRVYAGGYFWGLCGSCRCSSRWWLGWRRFYTNDLDGDDVRCVARSALVVNGSRSNVIRYVFGGFWKRKGHALLAAGLERLQTSIDNVLWSKLHSQGGIKIVVHKVVEYI